MCSSVNQIQSDPSWSPEDHLERVYRRGRQLRRRRQVGIASAALVAVVGLAVSVSGATSPLVHPLQVLTGTTHNSSDNNSSSVSTTTSTTAPDGPDVDVADGAHTSSTAAGAPSGAPSHKVSSQTATTVATASTVASGGNTNDTPPTSPIGDCKSGDLRYTTTTDKTSYRAGDTVDISLHVRNGGDRPCYIPSACSSGVWASVQNSEGTTVWQNSSHYVGCTKPATQSLLNPNDGHDYGVVGSWTQNNCPDAASTTGCSGDRVPIGTYTATAHRGNVAATSATIALR